MRNRKSNESFAPRVLVGGACFLGLVFFLFGRDHEIIEGSPEAANETQSKLIYSVIKAETVPITGGNKTNLKVRISRRVTEGELRSIATELKQHYPDARGMFYFLPDVAPDTGAACYATTHFKPNLEVRVLGLTREHELKFETSPSPSRDRDVIGTWLQDKPWQARLTMFRLNGKIFLEQVHKDGSRGHAELVEVSRTHPAGGRKFENAVKSKADIDAGQFHFIDPDGNLQRRDNEGVVWVSRRVRD